ncbi:MAG: hypothetical protein KAU03_02500 [Candidatus Altiarchaeales archaeon]|nr:hypothetical protein [Candidatus Altiarchaeales archaeon]
MAGNIAEETKKIVIARVMAMPDSIRLSIGGEGELDKEKMILHLQRGDEIGKKLIEMHLHYLRSLKERYAQPQ